MATKLQATNPQATKSQAVNRETIANLSKNHEAVQRLFTTIASVLMTAPKRDPGLCDEWDRFTKTYHDLYRQSQLNASTCADFLGTLETSLAPLSSDSGDRVIKARRQTIKAVIEMITVHHESAQTNSWKFYELADEVEKFSYKALDALEPKAEGGFWANLWSGAASRYQLIREGLKNSLDTMIYLLKAVWSSIPKDYLLYQEKNSSGRYIEIELNLSHHRECCTSQSRVNCVGQNSQSSTSGFQPSLDGVRQDFDQLKEGLVVFDNTWSNVHIDLNSLLNSLTFVHDLANTRASYNANLREAKKACLPLIACLREYSRGGHPE